MCYLLQAFYVYGILHGIEDLCCWCLLEPFQVDARWWSETGEQENGCTIWNWGLAVALHAYAGDSVIPGIHCCQPITINLSRCSDNSSSSSSTCTASTSWYNVQWFSKTQIPTDCFLGWPWTSFQLDRIKIICCRNVKYQPVHVVFFGPEHSEPTGGLRGGNSVSFLRSGQLLWSTSRTRNTWKFNKWYEVNLQNTWKSRNTHLVVAKALKR